MTDKRVMTLADYTDKVRDEFWKAVSIVVGIAVFSALILVLVIYAISGGR